MSKTAFHVWEFIEEELEARGWTKHDLAARMGDSHPVDVHYLALDFLEASKDMPDMNITVGTCARCLGLAFGTSAEFWTNLENSYLAAKQQQAAP